MSVTACRRSPRWQNLYSADREGSDVPVALRGGNGSRNQSTASVNEITIELGKLGPEVRHGP